ncbi:biotin-independent malonate decarboxylase subunit gamma [Alkalilimnicola ehrlichii MLHE-1]|uniref:Malonate decarboxylase gamma subunit n=1 Tax=Alkalilimnicola ehrlichii (strain ATCC BAA-1101 / DSM 17681 / MLHE-1) TaxID=187272 RepID=Q0A5S6_ALKEH|nr:biotin-independent malonate decarboxylase subunit gamma [Alkalilimnicola ehrlichii]ABI57811.1 malonate decarboxylase gamma subunit [Alkalilimnicola ehrlichii MLHE-1]
MSRITKQDNSAVPDGAARHYREASARSRMEHLVDAGTLRGLPAETGLEFESDDGVLVGVGDIDGCRVFLAAQDSGCRGGTFGETHAARLKGMLEAAQWAVPEAVVLLLDSGGVRLEEAESAMLGAAELVRGIQDLRAAGIPVLGVVGGRIGCFGAAALVARCADRLIMVEGARFGTSGVRVMDAMIAEQGGLSDSQREALEGAVSAGHRLRTGEADRVVVNDTQAIQEAIVQCLDEYRPMGFHDLESTQANLAARLPAAVAEQAPPENLCEDLHRLFPRGLEVTASHGLVEGGGVRTCGEAVRILGFIPGEPAGFVQVVRLAQLLLDTMADDPGQSILLLADAEQAFSVENEQQGFALALAHLANVVAHARTRGHRVIALLRESGWGASFIASAMMADELYALKGARIRALPERAVALFAPQSLGERGDGSLALERFCHLGAVDTIWDRCLSRYLNAGLAGLRQSDRRRLRGAQRCGRTAPLAVCDRVACDLMESFHAK